MLTAHLFAWLVSIEDPFEVTYDVAHVIKPNARMVLMKKEFMRAVALIEGVVPQQQHPPNADAQHQDTTLTLVGIEELLDKICEKKLEGAARSRSNTCTSTTA